MKLIGERMVVSAAGDGEGEGKVIIVGVKLDSKSKELLTWALMKEACPGDIVVALHVLDSLSEMVSGPGSFLSLVQTFDSLLSAYEGFCNIKQVNLKLKLCRGPSARKVLVRESIASDAAKVVVGSCNGNHIMRPWKSFANYCSRKLPKNVAVFAVRNGKVSFQRDINAAEHRTKNFEVCNYCKSSIGEFQHKKVINDGFGIDSLALVPLRRNGIASGFRDSLPNRQLDVRHGWSRLRRIFRAKGNEPEKHHLERILKRPNSGLSALVHPDKNQNSQWLGEQSSILHAENIENEVIVPTWNNFSWPPVSLNYSPGNLKEELAGLREKYASCRQFTYEELVLATSNFAPENLVGQGGSSYVYRGCLPDGKELAVKILRPFKDVLKEFLVEAKVITTLNHKNIISFLGFCFEHGKLFLIYDFLARGSLEKNLNGNEQGQCLFDWKKRFKVALGVAEALNYLHNELEEYVIHRDVKSSNILLSDNFEPRLSDFGFSCHVSERSSTITCSDVTGTFGYMAPEYFMHGKVSDKVDVFAFGVVLLEILSGRKAISCKTSNGQESLVMWAKPILEGGKVAEIVDRRLERSDDELTIERMFLAAKLCLRHVAKHRPPISIIMKVLRGEEGIVESVRQEVCALDGDVVGCDMQSHLSLALLDVDDDALSVMSNDLGLPLEEYLRNRFSRTPSLD